MTIDELPLPPVGTRWAKTYGGCKAHLVDAKTREPRANVRHDTVTTTARCGATVHIRLARTGDEVSQGACSKCEAAVAGGEP